MKTKNMYVCMDRWTDGWLDGQMDGRTNGRTDGWTDSGRASGRMDRSMDGWMDGWTDGWTDKWMDGQTDRQADGRTDGWKDGHTYMLLHMDFIEHWPFWANAQKEAEWDLTIPYIGSPQTPRTPQTPSSYAHTLTSLPARDAHWPLLAWVAFASPLPALASKRRCYKRLIRQYY
jgi:hypothetical protein